MGTSIVFQSDLRMTVNAANLDDARHPNESRNDDQNWVQGYIRNQQCWDEFLEKELPRAVPIKWGLSKRVFKRRDRIIKVWLRTESAPISHNEGIQKEFQINELCEEILWTLRPAYSACDGQWEMMEIDELKGSPLNVMLAEGNTGKVNLFELLRSLVVLSWLGVAYKQLRGRHIFWGEDRRPVFIDFGDSQKTSRWSAFYYNLAPIKWVNGRLQVSNFGYLTSIIIRNKIGGKKQGKRRSGYLKGRFHESIAPEEIAIQHHKNCNDLNRVPPAGSLEANYLFRKWKQMVCDWVEACPGRGCDLFRWEFKEGAIIWGGESWGVVWEEIRRKISFNDKRVVEYGCSMGLGPVHACLEGASSVHSFTDDPSDVDVGERAVEFFGVKQVQFSVVGNDENPAQTTDGAIGLALSIKANENNWDRVRKALTGCAVIVKRTRDGIEYLEK